MTMQSQVMWPHLPFSHVLDMTGNTLIAIINGWNLTQAGRFRILYLGK